MSDFTNLTPSQTFGDILNLNNTATPGQGFTASLVNVTDGLGNLCPLQISLTSINVSTVGGNSFKINNTALTADPSIINDICNETVSDLSFAKAIRLSGGTTAQRPAPPIAGMMRWNTDLNIFEGYDGVSWKQFTLV